jgi:hypothetical protein
MADASPHDEVVKEKSIQPPDQKQDRMVVERVTKEKNMTKEEEEEEKKEEEEEKSEEEEESEEDSEEPSVVCKCGTLAKKGKRVIILCVYGMRKNLFLSPGRYFTVIN